MFKVLMVLANVPILRKINAVGENIFLSTIFQKLMQAFNIILDIS